MTPAPVREALRKAAVQAVWSAAHDCTCSTDTPARHCTPCNICLDAIAAAVLAAADAGETEGPWRVSQGINWWGKWNVTHPTSATLFRCDSEPEARAVCNALNRDAARERGVGE